MIVDPASFDRRGASRFFLSVLVPRPIAWVSTCDAAGLPNLAPFSFFGGVTSDPPTLAVSVGRRAGARKDTARNALETGEFVVNVVDEVLGERMVRTSADLPPGDSEFELAGLTAAASSRVRPPRVAESPISMECRLVGHLEVGRSRTDLLIGEVLLFHLRDDLLGEDGAVAVERLRPLGRLGGELYVPVRETVRIPMPNP